MVVAREKEMNVPGRAVVEGERVAYSVPIAVPGWTIGAVPCDEDGPGSNDVIIVRACQQAPHGLLCGSRGHFRRADVWTG